MTGCDELQPSLDELKRLQRRLSEGLALTADGLRRDGIVPSDAVLADLQRFRDRFRELRTRLSGAGLSLSLDSLPDLERAASVVATQQRLTETLEQLLSLRHTTEPDFAPLAGCHEHSRQLIAQLQAGAAAVPAVSDQLTEAMPLGALRRLVTDSASLTDEAWARLNDVVAAAYGKELATATARQKLTFDNSTVTQGLATA